jgi:hypothetical protein
MQRDDDALDINCGWKPLHVARIAMLVAQG